MDDGARTTAVAPAPVDLRWTATAAPVAWSYRHPGVVGPVADFAVTSDLRELADGELLDVAGSLEASVAMLQARASEAIAELARRRERACADVADDEPPASGPKPEFVADEVAARLHLTRYAATRRVSEATALAQRLPATLAAWRSGDLDAPRVRIVVTGTEQLDDDDVALVDSAVAAVAPGLTTGELRGVVERETLRRLRGGLLVWTAPTGHRYRREPVPLLPRPLTPCPPVPRPDGPIRRLLRYVEPDGGLARLLRPGPEPATHTRASRITSPSLALPPDRVELLTRPSPPTDGPPPF